MKGFIADMRKVAAEATKQDDPTLRAIGKRLERAVADLERATEWIVTVFATDPGSVAAGSVYYLKLAGLTAGGWMMAKSALVATKQLAAGQGEAEFLRGKLLCAHFYAEHLLPQVDSLAESMISGGPLVRDAEEALL